MVHRHSSAYARLYVTIPQHTPVVSRSPKQNHSFTTNIHKHKQRTNSQTQQKNLKKRCRESRITCGRRHPAPIIRLRNCLNSLPIFGLVRKSPIISPVGQCFTVRFPLSCWSVRKKYQMFSAQVRFPELRFPFFNSSMVLLLSWYRIFFQISYP